MAFQTYPLILLIGGGMSVVLAAYAWRRRSAGGNTAFVLMMIGVAVWTDLFHKLGAVSAELAQRQRELGAVNKLFQEHLASEALGDETLTDLLGGLIRVADETSALISLAQSRIRPHFGQQ